MALELAAVALGLETFRKELENKNVRVWIDNAGGTPLSYKLIRCGRLPFPFSYEGVAGGPGVLAKGAAKAGDHNRIVHKIWLNAAINNTGIWICRVPSEDNIADEPSRGEFSTLKKLYSVWKNPVLSDVLGNPDKWEAALLNEQLVGNS